MTCMVRYLSPFQRFKSWYVISGVWCVECGVYVVWRGVVWCGVCSVVWCIWYTCMVRNAQRMAVIHGLATLMRPPHPLTLTLTVGDPKLAIEPS